MSGTVVIRFVAQTRARKDNLKHQWLLDPKRFGRRSAQICLPECLWSSEILFEFFKFALKTTGQDWEATPSFWV